jgi:hypothetical protein
MGLQVCMGASLQCTFGAAPSALMVLPLARPFTPMPAATISDCVPFLNVLPFGVCTSVSNPMVAAATAAALGVLTPMPCIPVPAGTWIPGSPKVLIGGVPALNNSSKLCCSWGGVIGINVPGQFKVSIP